MKAEQCLIASQVSVMDSVAWDLGKGMLLGQRKTTHGLQLEVLPLRRIAGMDISFPTGKNKAAPRPCASLVILEWPSLRVVHEAMSWLGPMRPYVPGYLAYREAEPLLELLREVLLAGHPPPDIIFTDGNGILHPRAAGLASHIGVRSGIRTVGVAKSFLGPLDGMTRDSVKQAFRLARSDGSRSLVLRGASGKEWGMAVCCDDANSATNPIFVSVGHGLSLATSVELCRRMCKFRIPEPVRQADLRSRAALRNYCLGHSRAPPPQRGTEKY
jgi:deoxyinosine 3'endonuclease (endonuclease V)